MGRFFSWAAAGAAMTRNRSVTAMRFMGILSGSDGVGQSPR
jgi:hypothetical protein